MKLLVISLLLSIACMARANECDSDLVADISQKLHGGTEVEEILSPCKRLPNEPDQAVLVLAYPSPESVDGISYYDVDLLLVHVPSKSVLAKRHQKRVWKSDAYHIGLVTVDTANYSVKDEIRAFGIVEYWGGSSTIAANDVQVLSLYSRVGAVIQPLLEGLVTKTYQGEANPYELTKRYVVMGETGPSGYREIIVNERVFEQDCSVKKGCVDLARSFTSYRLSATKGVYAVPKELQR